MQEAAGIDEPDYGVLLDDLFVPEGSVIPTDRLFEPRAEAELAFVLAEPLPGPSVNAADVIRATDFVLPCIEVVDRRFNARGVLVDTIADNASSGLVVLGGNPVGLHDIDIRTIGVTLTRNGVVEDTGVASAVMGNPLNAVAWLANKLHSLGVALEAGHVVLSGSFIKAIRFGAGDVVAADFTALGTVQLAVAP
jgi:2-keto-4-pentenoate hydratase